MKTKALLLLASMLLVSSSVFGAACLSMTSIAALQALGATGCDVVFADDTITFSNFTATGSATGALAVLDTNLAVGGNPLIGLAGYVFTDPGTNFGTGFTLSYTTAVKPLSCAAGFNCALTGVVEQSLITPGSSSGAITLAESAGSPATLNVGNQTDNLFGSINVQTLNRTATYNGASTLLSFESDVFATATSAVPEPLSLSMVGLGLVAMGVLGRKMVRNH